MINVLNMTKVGMVGDIPEFKFEFEFDNASTLPEKTFLLGQKTYLIAEGSTATNLSTETTYQYLGVDSRWKKVLSSGSSKPTTTTINNITTNGNYNIINNESEGYNKINVTVPGDIPSVLTTKNITTNGVYNAVDDNAEGYSSVDVNVANTYTAEDEGKVVHDGNLVVQTAYPTEITENDTYDTTNYNSITINVSGGSSSVVAICTFEFNNYQFLCENESGTIGEEAFLDCSALTFITISSSVTSIGNYAFSQCDELTSVTFEANSRLESIGGYAFRGCYVLTSMTIPSGVTSIGDYAFIDCVSLTPITIPNSVTSIGESAFGGCLSFETVTFESNSSLESIGESAFVGCSRLTSITIPNSVTSIGYHAFYDCTGLETLTFESTTPPTLGGDLGLPTTCIIRVPQGTLSDYTSASNYPDPSEYTYVEY